MKKQRLEGRVTTPGMEAERHQRLIAQVESIIERARDSTFMDAEYDAGLLEDLFKCQPIKVQLPPNEWTKRPQQGSNPDRQFVVQLYIERVKRSLSNQGLLIEPTT